MSDSDSTLPATDDFNSRFLEFDECLLETFDDVDVSSIPKTVNCSSQPSSFAFSQSLSRRKDVRQLRSRNQRIRKINQNLDFVSYDEIEENDDPNLNDDICDDDDDDEQEEEDVELSTFRNPKLLTARQLSLQSQRNSIHINSNLDKISDEVPGQPASNSTLLSLESVNIPKTTIPLTKEQINIQQKRIARRRESAKHKLELEKKMTVERLLKVNIDNNTKRTRGKGRGHYKNGIQSFKSNFVEDRKHLDLTVTNQHHKIDFQLGENDEPKTKRLDKEGPTDTNMNNLPVQSFQLNANEHKVKAPTLDPMAGYIRSISSLRLTPNCAVCFSDDDGGSAFALFNKQISVPEVRYCEMGCGRLRRYVCSKTGRSLCSLQCYKINLIDQPCDSNVLVSA